MHKLSERESYSHRKRTKATVGEEIKPYNYQKQKTKQKPKKSHILFNFHSRNKKV